MIVYNRTWLTGSGTQKGENMNLPTKITFSRIVLIILMMLGIFIMSFFDIEKIIVFGSVDLVSLIICIVFVIAAVTDFVDGYLARKNNQITDLGKFLDPIADKMLVNCTLILLVVLGNFSFSSDHMNLNVFVVIVFILRDLIVDGVRLMAAKKDIVIAANKFGKLKTIAQMVAIPIYLLNGFPFSYFDASWPVGLHIADILIYIALLFSVISGVIYVIQNRKVFLGEPSND